MLSGGISEPFCFYRSLQASLITNIPRINNFLIFASKNLSEANISIFASPVILEPSGLESIFSVARGKCEFSVVGARFLWDLQRIIF